MHEHFTSFHNTATTLLCVGMIYGLITISLSSVGSKLFYFNLQPRESNSCALLFSEGKPATYKHIKLHELNCSSLQPEFGPKTKVCTAL